MEEGPRRSGRARKQIKTLAEEQAEAAELAATLPARKKQLKAKATVKSVKSEAASQDAENEPLFEDEHADYDTPSEVEEPPPKKRKTAAKKSKAAKDGKQPYGAPPVGTMVPWYVFSAFSMWLRR